MTDSVSVMYMAIKPIDALCPVPGSIPGAMEELGKLDASESMDENLDDGGDGGGGGSQSVSGEDDDWKVVEVSTVRAVVLVEEGRYTVRGR